MDADAQAPPTVDPVDVLERVVRALGDEVAAFRRRALDAEGRARALLAERPALAASPEASGRTREEDHAYIRALESENEELRGRLVEAGARARAVASRIRFARQQDDAAAASEEVA